MHFQNIETKMKTIPGIRVLPMDKGQLSNMPIEKVQEKYFLNDLPFKQNGMHYFKTRGMKEKEGALVLFQYNRTIVAAAIYKGSYRFNEPNEEQYFGTYIFEKESIMVFDPIDKYEFRNIFKDHKRFSQVKQKLHESKYPQLIEFISKRNVRSPMFAYQPFKGPSSIQEVNTFLEKIRKELPQRLYCAAEKRGLTPKDIGEITGYDKRTFYKKMESDPETKNISKLNAEDILVFEKFCNINRDYILGPNPRDRLFKITPNKYQEIREIIENSGEHFNKIVNHLKYLITPDTSFNFEAVLRVLKNKTNEMNEEQRKETYIEIHNLINRNF